MGGAMYFTVKVRHYEADAYGHVNHACYVHYLETARVEALEAIGLSLPDMRRQGVIAVAAAISVKYHSPASPGETLVITTHVREMRGARTLWIQTVSEAKTGRPVVTAEVTGAFLTESGKPLRVPPSFREKLAALHVSEEVEG